MSGAAIFLMILIAVSCVILVLVVMVQNPKGGGLSGTFGGSGGGSQMFGVQRTNDFLTRATWILAFLIVVLTLLANFIMRDKKPITTINPPVKQEQPVKPPVKK